MFIHVPMPSSAMVPPVPVGEMLARALVCVYIYIYIIYTYIYIYIYIHTYIAIRNACLLVNK